MDDLRLSYSHWGMHSCYTYPMNLEPRAYFYENVGWPMTYFGDAYDAKYLHG